MSGSGFAILLLLAAAAMALSLLLADEPGRDRKALRWWAAALLVSPLGWFIYRLYPGTDQVVGALAGKMLIAFGFVLYLHALLLLGRRPSPAVPWLLLAPALVLLMSVLHWLVWPDRPMGTGLLSLVCCWIALACALQALRLGQAEQAGGNGRVLALNFGTVALILLLRSALLLLPEGTLFAAPLVEALSQDWLVAYVIIAPVVGTLNLALIDRARLTNRYRALANSDMLTGVASRGRFLEQAETRFLQSQAGLRALAVLLIDIDHFKAINDAHGHQVGDQVLQQVSRTIESALREVDLLGRIGGEEFAVLLPDAALEDALIVAERVRRSVARLLCNPESDALRVTVSVGCAVRKPEDTRFEAVLRRADLAMYAAKHAGRDRVSQFYPGLHAVAADKVGGDDAPLMGKSSSGR